MDGLVVERIVGETQVVQNRARLDDEEAFGRVANTEAALLETAPHRFPSADGTFDETTRLLVRDVVPSLPRRDGVVVEQGRQHPVQTRVCGIAEDYRACKYLPVRSVPDIQ